MRTSFVQFLIERLAISLPKKNLGIPRRKMPQIQSDHIQDFLNFMQSEGVTVRKIMIPVQKIKATQKEIDRGKIVNLMNGALESSLNKPVIISKDNYLLDGHHRWLALWNKFEKYDLVAHQANVNIKDLLEIAGRFSKVSFKKLGEDMETVGANI